MNTGDDHMILPISINYERIPEQSLMLKENSGGRRKKLALPGLFRWLLVSSFHCFLFFYFMIGFLT